MINFLEDRHMGKSAGRKHYSDSFKQNAVNLLIHRKKAVSEVADDLGLAVQTLYKWKRERAGLIEPCVETDLDLCRFRLSLKTSNLWPVF